jgi:2-hydroxy-3-keto-5-methylthiopentenyl-1-phosphate phosphatase
VEYLWLVAIKLLDSILGTGKTILTQKNKGVLTALTVIATQLIFFKVLDDVMKADSDLKMWVVSIASGVGTYIAILINQKLSKETVYINNILSDDREAMTALCNYLREHKIKNLVTDSYTKDWGKTLAVTVFAETKEQSKLVDKYIAESKTKFLRYVK